MFAMRGGEVHRESFSELPRSVHLILAQPRCVCGNGDDTPSAHNHGPRDPPTPPVSRGDTSMQRLTLGCVMIFCLAAVACQLDAAPDGGGQPHRRNEPLKKPTGIRLDLYPGLESDPDSTPTFVSVRADGQTQWVRFDRYSLTVLALHEGVLAEAHLAPILEKMRDPSLRKSVQDVDESKSDIVYEGDFFVLSIESDGGAVVQCAATVEYAPEPVRRVVGRLLRLSRHLPQRRLAAAYVRSRTIPDDRFAKLQEAGKLKFIKISDLPGSLQSGLAKGIARPGAFHALPRAHYDQLLPSCSHGHNLYIVADDSAYELTLFASESNRETRKKENQNDSGQ